MTDEHAIRAALADLADDQPPVPSGRLAGIRRRAIRHRRRQAGAAVLSAVAVAGIVVGVTRLPGVSGGGTPTGAVSPQWALPWTDHRNGSVPQSVLNNAVLAWAYTDPKLGYQGTQDRFSSTAVARIVGRLKVTWYVGQTIAHGQAVAVIFEVGSKSTGRSLVVGWAQASRVMHGQPAWSGGSSPWSLTTRPAPRARLGPEASEYVPVTVGEGAQVDNWIVVIQPPNAEGFDITSRNGSSGTVSGYPNSGGLVIVNAGPVTGDVMLTIGEPAAPWVQVPVGLSLVGGPRGVPVLAEPSQLNLTGFGMAYMPSGQGSLDVDERWLPRASYRVVGRCYNAAPVSAGEGGVSAPGGHGPLTIAINGTFIGTISCDGRQHELAVPKGLLKPHGIQVGITGSDLTAWIVALGRRS